MSISVKTRTLETSQILNLDMYKFIIASIREEDQKSTLLLKRFLIGFQEIWKLTQNRIFQLPDFWDIAEVEDRFLVYVQAIVGWTGKLTKITEVLDNDTLRVLISTSVALWKKRGTEDALNNVLYLTTGAQTRILNWFFYRWILEENKIAQERFGNDIYLIEVPGTAEGYENRSNLRIVDDGTLNRDLVKNLVKLMRPVSERYTITYVSFLDLFNTDDDTSKWNQIEVPGNSPYTELIVLNGTAKLENTTIVEECDVINDPDWQDQVAYFKVKVDIPSPGGTANAAGVMWASDGARTYNYIVALDPITNNVYYWETNNGSKENETTISYEYWGQLLNDVWHGIRIDYQHPNMKIYVDNNLVLENPTITNNLSGSLGFFHEIGSTIELDEVEMFELPLEIDEIDINPN
jgi:phage tail-like protein